MFQSMRIRISLVLFVAVLIAGAPMCFASEAGPATKAVIESESASDLDARSSHDANMIVPELVKTKPYRIVDIIRVANGDMNNTITDEKILDVKVVPSEGAKGFAYYDGRTTWKVTYNLKNPEDFDNDPEENCWKVIGGMTEKEKQSEFNSMDDGGAAPGKSGTGNISIKVFYKDYSGVVSMEVFPAKVVLKKLIVEVDWMEGSFSKSISKDDTRTIGFKPNINQKFIDAFGQAGVEVVIKDTPQKGNIHNIIRKDAIFKKGLALNRDNLSELLPEKYRNWKEDVRLFNDGLSYVTKRIIDKGYMDFDASRPDVIYVIGARRWEKKPGNALGQMRGVTALFEHKLKKYNVCYVFNMAIAESSAAVNGNQKTKIPWEAASLHTVLHECVAHCFPIRWENKKAGICKDPYWGKWRYKFIGHNSRNKNHDYSSIHKTCVATADSILDAAYYSWMKAPRLSDFSNAIGNSIHEKTRDIVRDYIVDGDSREYGRDNSETKRTANSQRSEISINDLIK